METGNNYEDVDFVGEIVQPYENELQYDSLSEEEDIHEDEASFVEYDDQNAFETENIADIIIEENDSDVSQNAEQNDSTSSVDSREVSDDEDYGRFTALFDDENDVNPLNNVDVLKDRLKEVFHKRKIPFLEMSEILHILKDYGLKVPKDPRTLMRRRKFTNEPVPIAGGHYIHLGIEKNLKHLAKVYPVLKTKKEIFIDISHDGVPVSKSSNSSLWVISGAFVNEQYPPFVVGAFHGGSKPKNVEEFLRTCLKKLIS